MATPTLTHVQILSALGAILGLLVSFLVIDEKTAQALAAAAAILVPIAFTIADALIRSGRAKAIGAGAKVEDGKLVSP